MNRRLLFYSFILSLSLIFDFTSVASPLLPWFPNKGQWESQILLKTSFANGAAFLDSSGITFNVFNRSQYLEYKNHLHRKLDYTPTSPSTLDWHAYQIQFLNANKPTTLIPRETTSWYENYFNTKDTSHWRTEIYGAYTYEWLNIYSNIDLQITSEQTNVKYNFICKPGSDIENIKIKINGAKSWFVKNNQLYVVTSIDTIIENAPNTYYLDTKEKIDCRYVVENGILGFETKDIDPKRIFVIDPVVVFSTYSGSFADNFGYTATYDNEGNAFAGSSVFGIGYPLTLGAYQTTWAGGDGILSIPGTDIAITKYSSNGRTRLYSTYLGGSNDELPHSLIVNSADELFLLGSTSSPDFPVTPDAYDTSFNGGALTSLSGLGVTYVNGSDIIITRLNANGTSLIASTFVGGTADDGLNTAVPLKFNYADEVRGEILIDENDNIYIGSTTFSADFPVTSNAWDTSYAGLSEGCVFKMDNYLRQMIWSSYVGSTGDDAIYSLELDKSSKVYVAGGTTSADLPFPATTYRSFPGGGRADGFVCSINAIGTGMLAGTYVATSEYDQCYFVEMNRRGEVFLLGQTQALGDSFIVNAGYSFSGGGQFITKLTPELDSVYWSTAFGTTPGSVNISPTAFLVDYCNKAYICGWGGFRVNRFGGTAGLNITGDAIQSTTDNNDFYIMVMEDDASALTFGSFFGGNPSADHVDGGTSRFDKFGVMYQSVCASCGAFQDFPIFPHPDSVASSRNNSPNCNNAVFKIDFNLPVVVADFKVNPIACITDTFFFENRSKLLPGSSIRWEFGDSTTSSAVNPTHRYTSPGRYTITLIITDTAACNSADTATKEVFILSNSSDTLSSVSICDGTGVQIGIPSVPGTGITFRWTPNYNLSRPDISNPIANPDTNTLYILVLDNGFCRDTLYQWVRLLEASLSVDAGAVLCPGDSLRISVTNLDPFLNLNYQWSPVSLILSGANSSNPLVSPEDTTWFYVTARSDQGCIFRDSILIVAGFSGPEVTAYAIPDSFDAGQAILLQAQVLDSVNIQSYLWQGQGIGNPVNLSVVSAEPDALFAAYVIEVVDSNGCKDKDTVIVYRKTYKCLKSQIFIPNAFSPDGDGINEVFRIRGIALTNVRFMVFDRWGQKLFESRDLDSGWDGTFAGKKCEPAVYGYYVEANCEGGEFFIEKGNVTLVR